MTFGATEPWAFTQMSPLSTDEFAKAAKVRGVQVSDEVLAELWRIGALAPYIEIVDVPVAPPVVPLAAEPGRTSSYTTAVRLARSEGRLTDPTVTGYRPDFEFRRLGVSATVWWNGLLYSRWQLVALRWLQPIFAAHATPDRHGNTLPLRDLASWERPLADDAHRRTNLLVALEARYLPEIRSPWIHLTNATWEKWDAYRSVFDPTDVLTRFNWTAEELGRSAMTLLADARGREPLGDKWSQLVRRAAPRAWDDLSGDMLCALDARIAAEILLRCYEDLADGGHAPALESKPSWYHLGGERLSSTPMSLDRNLGALGLSPHPGVVLVVEGETEEFVLPHVMERLRVGDEDGAVRSSVMRGTHNGLTKLVGFVASPLIERADGDDWLLQRNPSQVMVAVDPDTPFEDATAVARQRRAMVKEIVKTVQAQGVDPVREDLESFVDVRTWSEACFEYEHFSDEELADALLVVHPDCNQMDRATLVHVVGQHRSARHDIKHVWDSWKIKPPLKVALARQLLPTLLGRIDAALNDPTLPVPAVASVVADAFNAANARPRSGTWLLRGSPYQ